MTAQPLFDTARFRDRLTSSGMPEVQARAVTEGLDEALRGATATKADVDRQGDRLNTKIDAVEARLDAKIDAVEARLDAKIEVLGAQIAASERRLEESIGRRISELQALQQKWFVASLFGGVGLLFALLKFFP